MNIIDLMIWKKRRGGGAHTVSGVPPLMFKSNGANLNNYRIYGNTVNGESVGNLVESGEHAGEYLVPVTINSNTTSIYLPHQIRKVGDEAEYIDYGEQKQHRVRKNLLQNTATSQTINGVTFTVNNDGGVTCDGTVSEETPIGENALFFVPTITLPAGKYILSGCPAGGSEKTTFKQLIYANSVWLENDKGSGANFILTDAAKVSVRIVIYSGYTCDNLTFYPMIRKADIEDDTYEPYIENADLDITLPALPTISGTNILSVGTTVQPSQVMVKGKIQEVGA